MDFYEVVDQAVKLLRYDGHIAQYLGNGLRVYFGYSVAHESASQPVGLHDPAA